MSRIFSLSRCYQSYIAETIGRLNVVAFSFRLLRRLCSLVIKDVSEHGKRPFSSLLSICHLPVSFPLRHILRATRQVLMKLDTRRSPTVLPVRISCVCPHHRRPRASSCWPVAVSWWDIWRRTQLVVSDSAAYYSASERNPTAPDQRPQDLTANSRKRRNSHSLFARMDILVELTVFLYLFAG